MTSSLSRFNRAFDSLKKVISKTPEEINRQRLKYTSCATITDLVCKSSDKSSLLTIAVTSLIQLLENADSNNRLIIDESLNKIIRSSIDNSNDIAKVLIALLKILSKSTNERSLKAALWRFAELAHFVRPHKGKIYVQTLIPVFLKLAGRKEDGIHEVSASSFPRIFRYIGLFTTDSDIKVLLKAFLKNLSSASVEIRRAAAFNIIVICQHSRKPEFFFSHSLSILLDLLVDAQSTDRKNVLLIQGCLSCIRQILSCIAKPRLELEDELGYKNVELLLQIYELCFTFASSQDHNVVTAALETLQQLLLSASPSLVEKLTIPGTFTQSSVLKREHHGSTLSLTAQSEIFSVGSTIAQTDDELFSGELSRKMNALRRGSENLPDLSEEQKQKMTESWVQEQSEKDEDDVSSSSLLNMDTSHFANSDDEDNQCEVDSTLSYRTLSVDNIQVAREMNEKNSLNRSKSAFQSMKSVSMMSASLEASLINLSMDVDIGNIFDDNEIPLQYCARFLVTRFLISDKSDSGRPTRVSVMSLALSCLAQIIKIHPVTGFISVVKDKEIYEDFANLLEVVISHASHSDQQIRGVVRFVIGNVISASLVQDNYLLVEKDHHLLNETLLIELVGFLSQGLEDESSMCVRQCLLGVNVCLEPLLLTPEYRLAVPLLDSMFALMDSPYWLIKTKILEIFESISYDLLYFVADNSSYYQEKIFHKVILSCLEDADGRVRRAAAQCLSKFVLHAYNPMDHNYELVAATFARRFKSGIEIPYISEKGNSSMSNSDIKRSAAFNRSLARVVHKLSQHFSSKSSSKNVIIGYCEALSFLANEYPPIQYADSWSCSYFQQLTNTSSSSYSPCELFDAALLLMTNSALSLNFDVHIHLLKLSSQLFVALCNSNFKVTENSSTSFDRLWSYLEDAKLKDLAEFFLRHLMRLSTIFSDVVTDVTVKSSVTLNSTQPLPRPIPTDQPLLMQYQLPLVDTMDIKQSENFTKTLIDNKSTPFGQYNREPRYLKLKVALKSAYNNYQVTLKPESSEKFISFLDTFLNSFATVLDFITVTEVDRICKELLRHLRNFMIFLPVSSVHCVVQLFKCVLVFGNNRISDQLSSEDEEIIQNCSTNLSGCGFHTFCFQRPHNNLTTFLEMKQHHETETRKDWELPQSPSRSIVAKQRRNFNINSFPSYIKLFEPNVIQSLKQYTVASDTALQAEVLTLLSQLIQLKVNYCLLDSEQVFIKFLLSQFQLIEDEQLQFVDKLLPAMFDFLIQLANEKHSKPVMSVPKVIQLCDSLTASIQSVCHCILAIEPVVKHVFTKFTAIANSEEIKELETQQDVLFSILLRLIHNPKSLPLLTIVLNNSVDEKKLQRSMQITQILFTTVVACHMPADEESRSYFLELLFTLHPASFDDQILLCSMFDSYRCNKTKDLNSWIPFISVLLLALLSKYDEDTIISGLEKLRDHPVFAEENTKDVKLEDPLCVNVTKSTNICSETAFVQLLYRMLNIAFQHLERTKLLGDSNEKIVLLRELLLIIGYIVKSGKFELISKKLIENYAFDEEHNWIFEMTRSSSNLSTIHPVIALQWYELLLYLRDKSGELRWYFGQSSIRFSSGRPSSNVCSVERPCIGNDAIKIGVFLLACECQNEFIHDEVVLSAFLENYFSILINCLSEEPVQKMMAGIRNSEPGSRVLMNIIRKMLDESGIEDNKFDDVLYLLDFVHEKIYEEVFSLCCRSIFLNSSSFPVRERAFMLSTKIISSFSTKEKVKLKEHLSEDQFLSVIGELSLLKSWQSQTLLNSIRNLAHELYNIQVPENDSSVVEELENLQPTSINKEWFFKEVKKKCYDDKELDYRTLAVLLGQLELQDLFNIMEDKSFRPQILPYALDVGTNQSLKECKEVNDDSSPSLSPLFIASRSTLHHLIEHVRSSLPQVHEVYWPVKRVQQKREIQYSQRIDSLFSNKSFSDDVLNIIPAVKEFIVSVQKLKLVILPESFQEIVDFAVLCSQIAHWQTNYHRKWSKTRVIDSIQCCSSVLKLKLALDLVSPVQIGSIISAVFSVTESHFKDVIKLPNNPIMENAANADLYSVHHSSHEMSTLIDYFITKVPVTSFSKCTSLEFSLRELLLVLSRSDLIYNYARIPLEIWKSAPESHVIMGNCLTLNTIPENYLLDSDILRNFVSRLMFIGWNSRLQFEECWMLLLIAFNSIPEEEFSEEEIEVLSQVNVVAVSAVASILVQTMYHPQPGCKISPNILHVSRYNNFHLTRCRKIQKLTAVHHLLSSELKKNKDIHDLLFDNVNVNLEKLNHKNVYSFNQISIEYLSLCCQKNLDATPENKEERLNQLYQERIEIFQKMGIDVNSCVYFLMDFYSRWLLKPHTHSVHVLLEVVNSMFIISDLFTEISQFTWLLESCIIMWQKYQKDNDTVCSYLIVMMCKAAAVFVPVDSETKKLVTKALRTGLSSKFGLVQSAALHGLLYLLEKIFKKNTLNNWDNLSCEFESEVLSISITFVLQNVNVDLLELFEKETAECLISTSFYLIQNNAGGDNASLLIDRMLKLSVRACKLKLWDVHSVIMQGFYNLLLFDYKYVIDYNNELGQLVKEILSTVSCPPFVCIQCLQMLATCMYLSDDFEDRTNEEANESFDTEKLVARMEKISFFFKRIQTGTKSEARFICTLLPQILIDLFPSSEILNKVILEFLSPSQRYPELMAQIVFRVFQHMMLQSELPLIQDWVLSLLNNSRNYSTEKAVFYLTCLFISACSNPWLSAFFPLISLRHKAIKLDDRQLLYLSAVQFYSQLDNDSQKKAFVTTFQAAEENDPSSPLSGILKMIH